MKKSEIFIFCCLSFIIGIGFRLAHGMETTIIYIFLLIVAISLTIFWKNMNLRILFFGILFLFSGMMRVSVKTRQCLVSTTGSGMYGEKIKMQGLILDEVEISYDNQRFALDVKKIETAGGLASMPMKILVNANLYPRYFYGDELEVECKLKKPEPFGNFRYDKYLELDNISAICYYPKIFILERNRGNKIYAGILAIKRRFNEIILNNVYEPQASILSAILLGNKYGISDELKGIFSRAGTSHILAVSGMHIGILSLIIFYALIIIGISRKKAFYFISAIIILYVIMIGAPASAIRAAVMGFILMLALQFGRLAKLLNALLLVACLMLLIKPGLLFYDIGFQFSFIAILGIYSLYPVIKKFLIEFPPFIKSLSRACRGRGKWGFFYGRNRVEKKNVAREEKISAGTWWLGVVVDILSLSLAAEIFILPLSVYYFSIFSVIAPFSNLAVVWLVPIIMFLGLALVFAGWVIFYIPIFGFILKIIGLIISFLLGYFIVSTKFLTSFSWSSFEITNFPLWGVVLLYAIIGGAAAWSKCPSPFFKREDR